MRMDFNSFPVKIGFVTDIHLHYVSPRSRIDDYPQVILDKLVQVGKIAKDRGWAFIVFGGDLFHATKEPLSYICETIERLIDWRVPIYGVIGNHDFRGSLENFYNSATGVVYTSGVIQHLSELSLTYLGKKFMDIRGIDYDDSPKVPQVKDERVFSVLVSHQFAAPFFNADGVLLKEDIAAAGWDMALIGHDHSNYPVTVENSCCLVRPGGLSRGTKTVTDRTRQVCVAEIEFSTEGVKAICIPLEIAPSAKVFSTQKIERESVGDDIKKFVQSISIKEMEQEGNIERVLEGLTEDAEVLILCKGYLRGAGII